MQFGQSLQHIFSPCNTQLTITVPISNVPPLIITVNGPTGYTTPLYDTESTLYVEFGMSPGKLPLPSETMGFPFVSLIGRITPARTLLS